MGLLNLLHRKDTKQKNAVQPEEKSPPAEENYSGLRVEVTAFDGKLLFAAKLVDHRGDRAKLLQFSDLVPIQGEPPLQVQIRGYNPGNRKAVYMEGAISPLPQHAWQVEELKVVRVGNDRAFFRLETDLDATLTTFGSGSGRGEYTCKLVNISIGGVCISTDLRLHEGDKFLLKLKLMEDRDISMMFCEVVRVMDKGEGRFEYGCRFLELSESDEERISVNIFAAQRKKRV